MAVQLVSFTEEAHSSTRWTVRLTDVPYSVLQSVASAKAVSWQGSSWAVCHPFPSSSQGRDLEFARGADDSSLTLREGHLGIFSIHQLLPKDGFNVHLRDGTRIDGSTCV